MQYSLSISPKHLTNKWDVETPCRSRHFSIGPRSTFSVFCFSNNHAVRKHGYDSHPLEDRTVWKGTIEKRVVFLDETSKFFSWTRHSAHRRPPTASMAVAVQYGSAQTHINSQRCVKEYAGQLANKQRMCMLATVCSSAAVVFSTVGRLSTMGKAERNFVVRMFLCRPLALGQLSAAISVQALLGFVVSGQLKLRSRLRRRTCIGFKCCCAVGTVKRSDINVIASDCRFPLILTF